MKKFRKFSVLVMVLFGLMISTQTSSIYASMENDFIIEQRFPDNQIGNVKYYNLLVTPNESQTIYFNVKNVSKKELNVNLELKNGSTVENADKQYLSDIAPDPSMKYPFNTVASLPKDKLQLKPGESQDVAVSLNFPSEDFDGVIVGGIRVYTDAEESNESGNFSIVNRMNYIMVVQLQSNLNAVSKNLNLISYGGKVNSSNAVYYANIQNDQPVVMNNLKITGGIRNKNNGALVGTVDLCDRGILPNTNFDVIYKLEDQGVKSGSYSLNLKIEDEQNVWEWNEDFEISKKEADKINDQVLKVSADYTLQYIIGFLLLIIIILLLMFFILFWKRRKEDEEVEDAIE